MKAKSLLFITLLSLSILFTNQIFGATKANSIFEEDTNSAITYNDKMIAIQSKVDDLSIDYIDAIDTEKGYNMKGARKACLKGIKIAKKEIKKLGKFDDDDAYQKQMIELMGMYTDIVKVELTKMAKMALTFDSLTDQEIEEYNGLYDILLQKYIKAFDKMETYQATFCNKWNFTVE